VFLYKRFMLITKADGSTEQFKVEKLRRSLRRAGATPSEVNEIVSEINTLLHENIGTQEIYRHAFTLLQRYHSHVAAKYSVRRALFGLGPTGFPFELFLKRLFEHGGYTVQTGIMMQGGCAEHEIDIAAYKTDHSFIGEAKFHARPGTKTDLQVAMYSYARLLDLKNQKICGEDICGVKEFWLVTNTKFTSAAEKYAECTGIQLLSWEYPKKNNLHDRIERAKIYPITVLQTLSHAQITTLIARNIIVCRDLVEQPHILRHLHLSQRKQEAVLQEATHICQS
jgi:hypothetical protein